MTIEVSVIARAAKFEVAPDEADVYRVTLECGHILPDLINLDIPRAGDDFPCTRCADAALNFLKNGCP